MDCQCINFCVKGQCSNCGNCCTELLPLTTNEVNLIKAYVKEKRIKPFSNIFFKYNNKPSVNLMCPFRDFKNKKCRIYEVRPKICRVFKCNQDIHEIETNKNKAHRKAAYNKGKSSKEPITKMYSLRELIYGDKLDTTRILVGNLVRVQRQISIEGVKNTLVAFGRKDLAIDDDISKVLGEYKYFNDLSVKRGD